MFFSPQAYALVYRASSLRRSRAWVSRAVTLQGKIIDYSQSILQAEMTDFPNLSYTSTSKIPILSYRVFSHDVRAAILVSQNNETAAMLVSQV